MSAEDRCETLAVSGSGPAADGEQAAELACRLRSLKEGGAAVLDAVALGVKAVPLLRELLFERDSAGIFAPRQRAVKALAALDLPGVLREFVERWEPAADPVERLGDEAVLGTAARALAAGRDQSAYPLLCATARRHRVPGVIEALGAYRRAESAPLLIAALEDDCAAGAAEEALRALGRGILSPLTDTASRPATGLSGGETPSSRRRRLSALRLLLELGASRDVWEKLAGLVEERDHEIAALACRLGLVTAGDEGKRLCARRLVALLPWLGWPQRQEAEESLAANLAFAAEFVEQALAASAAGPESLRLGRWLRRVKAKALAAEPPAARRRL